MRPGASRSLPEILAISVARCWSAISASTMAASMPLIRRRATIWVNSTDPTAIPLRLNASGRWHSAMVEAAAIRTSCISPQGLTGSRMACLAASASPAAPGGPVFRKEPPGNEAGASPGLAGRNQPGRRHERRYRPRDGDPFRAKRTTGPDERLGRLHRQRTGEQEALSVRAAEPLQLSRLHLALNPFGHHAGFERAGQRQDALDNGGPPGKQQAVHERPVDLEGVHGQLVQVAQRRVAGPEVIEIDLHAEVAQFAKHER